MPQDLKDFIKNQDTSSLTTILADRIKGFLAVTQSSLGYLLELVLIPVLAFYFLWDYRSLTKEFYGLVPKKRRREAMRVGRDIGMILQDYVVGQVILCLIAGLVTGIVLWALGMPYVIVLALFAAITRAIPIIGPVVSGIPIVLVGLLSSGYAMAFWLLVFVIVMHFAESKFIMPKFIGDRLHLHPGGSDYCALDRRGVLRSAGDVPCGACRCHCAGVDQAVLHPAERQCISTSQGFPACHALESRVILIVNPTCNHSWRCSGADGVHPREQHRASYRNSEASPLG